MLSLSILSSCYIFTRVLFETQGARLFSTFQFLYSYFFSRGLAWQNGWVVTGLKSWKNQGNVNARMQLTRHPDPIRSRLVSGDFSLCKPLFFYCCDAIKVLSWIAPWRLPTCKRLRYCDTHPILLLVHHSLKARPSPSSTNQNTHSTHSYVQCHFLRQVYVGVRSCRGKVDTSFIHSKPCFLIIFDASSIVGLNYKQIS